VDWMVEVLALGPEESLGTEAGVGSSGVSGVTLAKSIRPGSCWIDGRDDILFALLVDDRLNGTFALLLCFE